MITSLSATETEARPVATRSALAAHCALAQVHFDMYGTMHLRSLATSPTDPVDFGAAWRGGQPGG